MVRGTKEANGASVSELCVYVCVRVFACDSVYFPPPGSLIPKAGRAMRCAMPRGYLL